MEQSEVLYVAERQRYELRVKGQTVGFAEAVEREGVVTIPYVQVDREFEGRGLGSLLMQGVMQDLLAKGKRVDARCGFAAAYVRRHREYRGMVL